MMPFQASVLLNVINQEICQLDPNYVSLSLNDCRDTGGIENGLLLLLQSLILSFSLVLLV